MDAVSFQHPESGNAVRCGRTENLTTPSARDWEDYKDTIVDLYLGQKMTMSEVGEKMKRRHGFRATKRMYLTRFKQWNVHKNTSAGVKDRLCTRLLEDHADGRDLPHLTPEQLKKLLRHCRDKPTQESTVTILRDLLRTPEDSASSLENRRDHLPTNIPSHSTDDNRSGIPLAYTPLSPTLKPTVNSQFGPARSLASTPEGAVSEPAEQIHRRALARSIPRQRLSAGELTTFEEVLHLTRTYYRVRLQQYALSRTTSIGLDIGTGAASLRTPEGSICPLFQNTAFWAVIKSGIYFLKTKNSHVAWTLLRQAGGMVPLLCDQQPFALLKDLYSTISPVNVRVCPMLRVELLRLFARCAHERLGPNHPFSTICYRLWMGEGPDEMSATALHLMLEDSEKVLPASHTEVFELRRTLVRLLRRNRDFSKAEALSLSLVKDTEGQCGENDVNTRIAMCDYIHTLNDQSRYREALDLAQEVLRRTVRGHTILDERSIYAMGEIAEICMKLGRIEPSALEVQGGSSHTIKLWRNKSTLVYLLEKLNALSSQNSDISCLGEPCRSSSSFHSFTVPLTHRIIRQRPRCEAEFQRTAHIL